MSTSIYFTLLVVHTYYYIVYILIGGEVYTYFIMLSCFLFFPPCLYLYSFCIPMYVLSMSSVITVLVRLVGKENIIVFHSMREKGGLWRKKEVSAKIISVFICLSFMPFCLYVCLCLSVLFSFDFVWFVGVLSLRIYLVFTCSQSFCSS